MQRTCFVLLFVSVYGSYQPNWESLDRRPIPQWYRDAKFGIFNHWGLYSAPGLTAMLWYNWKVLKDPDTIKFIELNYKSGFEYADFAASFTAEYFNASSFVETIENSGARYFVVTAKHYDGYTLWPSRTSWNWNSKDTGPHRDLIGELTAAFDKIGRRVKLGLYLAHIGWGNPVYLQDEENDFETQTYVDTVSYPQMLELVNNYKPDIFWSDGDQTATPEYWRAQKFLAWLYNHSPVKDTVVVNDRWGKGMHCGHGGFHNCDNNYRPGFLKAHKWENCMTVDRHAWAYRRTMKAEDVLSIEELIAELVTTVSYNGNLLMNIGPTGDGRIPPIFEERLNQMGTWLRVNGEAIYDTRPWVYQQDPLNENVWYTSVLRSESSEDKPDRAFNRQDRDNTIVYAIILRWPKKGLLKLRAITPSESTTIQMLGLHQPLTFEHDGAETVIRLNEISWEELPNVWAWTIRMEFLATDSRNPLEQIDIGRDEL